MSEASGRLEMERRIVEKCLRDDAFRQRLLADPKATLDELGTRIPDGVRVVAVEETADTIYLVLPSVSRVGESGEIHDQDLETVAGGESWTCSGFTCGPGPGNTCQSQYNTCGTACMR
jgi:hypothetical protein